MAINPNSTLYTSDIKRAAEANGVPVEILTSLIQKESNFDQSAVGSSGEIGLLQLMPATVKALGINPYDAGQNILGGAEWLRKAYDKAGNWKDALAIYNSGRAYDKAPQARTRAYADEILKNAAELGYDTNNGINSGSVIDDAISNVQDYFSEKYDTVVNSLTGNIKVVFDWLADNALYLVIGLGAIILVGVSAYSLI